MRTRPAAPGASRARSNSCRLVCNPKYAVAHINLGNLLEKLGKDADAEASYREAIRLNPTDAMTHWFLATILEKRDDADGAIVEIREYIRKGDPDNDGEARLAELLKKKTT